MRAIALSLLCTTAFLFAGCTSGTQDEPGPPNADPNPPESYPPLTNSSLSSTGTPTATPSASRSETGSQDAGVTFAKHDAEDTSNDGDFPGMMVSGHLTGSGPSLRIEATANNFGERDYRVPDGKCAKPWTEELKRGGTTVAIRQPGPTCQSFGLAAFPAHDFLSASFNWNGTLWDDKAGAYVRAPAGDYTWLVSFDVFSGGSGSSYDDHGHITLDFHVTVP